MSNNRLDRRTFTATATGFAAGVFATSLTDISAQEGATPVATVPQGYVSMRVRTMASPEGRVAVNDIVIEEFIPDVQQLEGYGGYLLGDVLEDDTQSLSVLLVNEQSDTAGFDELAAAFVAGLRDTPAGDVVATTQWEGELLISGYPATSTATPVASPADTVLRAGYAAVRIHSSLPGTDPRDFVPLATEGFLPLVEGLAGFEGYLWFPIEGGFVAISLFDSETSAMASTDEALDWAAEFLTEYTDGNPQVINASIVWAEFPLLSTL